MTRDNGSHLPQNKNVNIVKSKPDSTEKPKTKIIGSSSRNDGEITIQHQVKT